MVDTGAVVQNLATYSNIYISDTTYYDLFMCSQAKPIIPKMTICRIIRNASVVNQFVGFIYGGLHMRMEAKI